MQDESVTRPTNEERDRRVLELYEQVLEVEQRLIPTGLHVFGLAPDDEQCADMLRMVASFDRPEAGARSLPALVAEGLALDGELKSGSFKHSTSATSVSASATSVGAGLVPARSSIEDIDAESTEPRRAGTSPAPTELQRAPRGASAADAEAALIARERVDEIVREAVARFMRGGKEPAVVYLEAEAGVVAAESRKVFDLLEGVRAQLSVNSELDSLARALRGEYVEPGPGADVVQNPSILPTGRNTHAINPYSVPSDLAYARAERVVKLLLERHRAERGRYPRAMALVLWGLDNIKTQGEGVAQALWLLGVRPVRDAMNRVADVEPIRLDELGRPRIDVVMTVSGIFRDLFGATMLLLDKAVRRVAELDEPPELNYVRANILEESRAAGRPPDEAALRIFSNAPGNYGTNVNFMVLDSQWETGDALGELFVTRKCFAYGRDRSGRALEGREAPGAMGRALARVEATYQNVDSFEIGMTDVDHYFEYLGGVSRAVESRAKARPSIYVSDSLSPQVKVRSLEEIIRLETRAKTLNPKWYEGMLRHGFRGVAEIESRVANTFGWSATADAVDEWVYAEVAETFVFDEAMLERLSRLNPHSARALVGRLLEAHGRGFWRAEAAVVERLRDAFAGIEDRIEGVA